MRDSCLFCYRKHVSQAIILLIESKLGYPEHADLAVGHLAEAESETIKDYPELAELTREERVKLMEDDTYNPNLMALLAKARQLLAGKK